MEIQSPNFKQIKKECHVKNKSFKNLNKIKPKSLQFNFSKENILKSKTYLFKNRSQCQRYQTFNHYENYSGNTCQPL